MRGLRRISDTGLVALGKMCTELKSLDMQWCSSYAITASGEAPSPDILLL